VHALSARPPARARHNAAPDPPDAFAAITGITKLT